MGLENKTILLISPERWGVNYVSKHHYAIELADKGCRVFFLDPPSNKNQIISKSARLKVLRYKQRYRGLNRLPDFLRIPLLKSDIHSIRKLIGQKIEIVWSFDPYRFQDLHLFEADHTIYHSADFINSSWDTHVARVADLVLATNLKILNRYRATPGTKYLVGHGLSDYFINPELGEIPSFKKNISRISVGYSGNLLMSHIDRRVFKKIITDHQDLDFYFFGPYASNNLSVNKSKSAQQFVEFLKKESNCFLLGPKKPAELYSFLSQMDILLICYLPDSITNPHKTLEYLSTGKVLVSNYMEDYEPVKHLLEMSEDNNNLSECMSKVARNLQKFNNRDLMDMRISFAKSRSYKNRIVEIENILQTIH